MGKRACDQLGLGETVAEPVRKKASDLARKLSLDRPLKKRSLRHVQK